MARYRLNKKSAIVHDTATACDDAERDGLVRGGYLMLAQWIRAGAEPCDHCFRSDAAEEEPGE